MNWLSAIVSLATAGLGAYSAYKTREQKAQQFKQTAKLSRASTDAAVRQATETRQAAIKQQEAMRAQLEQQSAASQKELQALKNRTLAIQTQARQAQEQSQAQLAQARKTSAAQIAQAQKASEAQIAQAETQSRRQIAQAQASSKLAIQQRQLQAAMARSQEARPPVTSRVRKRVGTPASMRTGVDIGSALAIGGGGTGATTGTRIGGLNV